jgi:hypothetical protein
MAAKSFAETLMTTRGFNMANPLGRPSLLTPELVAKAREYLFSYEEQGAVSPSVSGLACWLGISKASVYNYGEQNTDFLGTLDAIQAKQETVALNKGITGEFNSTIAKLVLANHGYSDRVQQDHVSSDASMTPTLIELVAPLISPGRDSAE